VERRRSDRDRRRNVVTLTPQGRTCLHDAEQVRERVERDFLAPLDDLSAEALTATLLALHRARAEAGHTIVTGGHLPCGRPD
jgi:DNA-binding MarR family transcriptional regulator